MTDAMASRALAAPLSAFLFLACSPRVSAPPPVSVPAAVAAPRKAPRGPAPLPVQTREERDLEDGLRKTVEHLAVDIGERNVARSWNMASATDDLARALEQMGYDVRRQGIVMGDDVVQNLEVRAGGGAHGAENVVVAAHFDTAPASPGANEGSGAAAILELSRIFRTRKTSRTLRFVLLSNGAPPNAGTDHTGGLVYGKDLVAQGVNVVGAICLDGIGAYRTEPGSEHATADLLPLLPDTADFLAVVGTDAARPFFEQVSTSMKEATLKVATLVVGNDAPLVSQSDCWGLAKVGFPIVAVTDTASLRYPHHQKPTDLPKELDFDRMARAVEGLARTVSVLSEP